MGASHQHRPIDVTLPADGVFVLESHHAPGFQMAPQRHDFLELFYVLSGAGAFHVDGRVHPCRAGDLVAVPAGRDHHIADDPAAPLALYGICVAPAVWRAEPELLAALPAGRLSVGRPLAARVRADLRRLLFEQTLARPGGRVLALGLTLHLLGLIARAARPAGPGHRSGPAVYRAAIERYVADLPHRFFEATDLDRAAGELGMSRRRFTQLFRQVAGRSWSEYLTGLRMDYACQLLRDTTRSVVATAFECGYEDVTGFYRAFKRHTGLPPRAWREAARGPALPDRQIPIA
ncbi:MAG TPA: AraC family transcriptional regulator [Gemmataceae bacterium]|jgi:AraC family L-rhamnose operon regulatory protein RhaS